MTTTSQVQIKHGIVKQILSGDSIVIRGQPKGGPPPEKTLVLSNITAPKLARKATGNADETKDEPYAWEAREFLRKKLIGQEVIFTSEKPPNATREYGAVWLGKDTTSGENITESLVSEGLVLVKRERVRNITPDLARLQELEDAAKSAGKGRWSGAPLSEHVRDVKWSTENPRNLVDKLGGKPVKAVIEHVRDGSTVFAFLLPDFYNITLMISGIRCPGFNTDRRSDNTNDSVYAEEARYFVESRLLQRDIEIVLESVINNNFVGSIFHPKGNIAEVLLHEGLARCVDWSMSYTKSGANKLHLAEKAAKEKRLRIWKDYEPQVFDKEREFTGTVTEIAGADALIIKTQTGALKKVFLSSIRPPREKKPVGEDGKIATRPKDFRPLYDIPWMFEAREFLRKKLIKKSVKVVIDYVQPARDNFPEKTCCTITIGKTNIAETMVSKGLATVIRYRQNDDQRSSHYHELLAAESKAEKLQYGVHAKKDIPMHRIKDLSGDPTKAKSHLSALKRTSSKAVVEFVTSGSRLKLFVPKESCLIIFLLAGVKAPRGPRPAPGGGGSIIEGEPYGEEALAFTKEHCLQRDVEIEVEGMESKGGSFIGWLIVDDVNLSVALVEEGLAEVSSFTDQSVYYGALKAAEERAKAKKLNIWKDFVEVKTESEKVEEEKQVVERKVDYQKVVVSEMTPELHFYAQNVDQGSMLESLVTRLRQELAANPPLPGSYNPKRGQLAAAKFTDDNEWYRVMVEKISGTDVTVLYIDYGNRETINVSRVAALPPGFANDKPYASEYILACVNLPHDNDDKKMALSTLSEDIRDRTLLLNVEYKVNGLPAATLIDSVTIEDIAKSLILDGWLLVDNCREKRLAKLITEYRAAQTEAKANHRNIWRYGDITEDDAKEFGVGRI